jgi:hypothetical protein
MSDAQTGTPALTGNVLLYKNPEPLSLEAHSKLGLKNIERPFGFVETTHVVPLTVQEFGMAATSLPIIFAPDRKTPLAVLSARSGENLYVDGTGNWELDGYIPAFIRRYPFVFAADQQGDNFVVCIDTQAEMIGENPDLPLFENGQPSQVTKSILDFSEQFEQAGARTQAFMNELRELDLLMEGEVTIQPEQEQPPFVYRGFQMVNEEKLAALRGDQLRKMSQSGMLPLLYAHLFSLSLMREIFGRQAQQGKMPQPQFAPVG